MILNTALSKALNSTLSPTDEPGLESLHTNGRIVVEKVNERTYQATERSFVANGASLCVWLHPARCSARAALIHLPC